MHSMATHNHNNLCRWIKGTTYLSRSLSTNMEACRWTLAYLSPPRLGCKNPRSLHVKNALGDRRRGEEPRSLPWQPVCSTKNKILDPARLGVGLLEAKILTKDDTLKARAATLIRMCKAGGVVGRHVIRICSKWTSTYSSVGPYGDFNGKYRGITRITTLSPTFFEKSAWLTLCHELKSLLPAIAESDMNRLSGEHCLTFMDRYPSEAVDCTTIPDQEM